MTKSQADVVGAALKILDEQGAAAVSLRAVAGRLGVRMNTVLWHTKSKARLEELLADAIVAGVSLEGLPEQWHDRAAEIARRYRAGLLAHRDGALVVAGTYAAEPATLALADALVSALLDGGYPERDAAWTCWSIVYFVLGLTQEEQAQPGAVPERLTRALAAYPALQRVMPHLAAGTFGERFDHGLRLLLGDSGR